MFFIPLVLGAIIVAGIFSNDHCGDSFKCENPKPVKFESAKNHKK